MTVPLACALTWRTPATDLHGRQVQENYAAISAVPIFRGTTITCKKESNIYQGHMISSLTPDATASIKLILFAVTPDMSIILTEVPWDQG